jgi:uncharacterized protein
MSAQTKTQSNDAKESQSTSSIVWFEIPVDTQKFYGALFGWTIELFPGMTDYWRIDTGGGDDTPEGGLMKRKHPDQPITNYVNVASVDESAAKVRSLAEKSASPKQRCRKWATSLFVRTPKATSSRSGKRLTAQSRRF